jgi:membrane protease YdiL (CAAX protease family)
MVVKRSPLLYIILVFALSLPFWLLGALVKPLPPINLSLSAFQFVCTFVVACILVYREKQPGGLRRLFKRAFDVRSIQPTIWWLPVLFLFPLLLLCSYGLMLLLGRSMPHQFIPWSVLPLFFVIFFLAAVCEEIGWTGYVTDPMQARRGALVTGVLLGAVWGLWHVVGWKQEQPWIWVAGQYGTTIGLRVIMVWLYNNTGKSLFAVVLFHTMINVSEYAFPNYGSYYDPILATVLITVLAVIVTLLWGPKTLARFSSLRLKNKRSTPLLQDGVDRHE